MGGRMRAGPGEPQEVSPHKYELYEASDSSSVLNPTQANTKRRSEALKRFLERDNKDEE